jgi:signal transduction histidine kinase
MWRFRDLPIRQKLTLLLGGIVSVVLFLSAVPIMVANVHFARKMLARKYSTLANVVAAQSAVAVSIADIDATGAQNVLDELEVESSVVFAALYNIDGVQIARHAAPEFRQFTPSSAAFGTSFSDDGYLDVTQEVKLSDGTVVGKLYLRATAQELNNVLMQGIAIGAAVFVLGISVAVVLAFFLQRIISAPILTMAKMAENVSTEHDYSIRVEKHGDDELGTLCDGFNSMLAEIQARDAELAKHRAGLEELVHERTAELQRRSQELERAQSVTLRIMKDIEDARRNVTQRARELERSNKALDEFAYVASHDLRSPLRGIDNLARWIAKKDGDNLSEQSRKDLDTLRERVARMNGLLEGLLQYSRIGRKQYEVEEINTAEMVRKIADLLHRPEQFKIEIAEEMPILKTQRVPLEQVLRNLIDNAIKHHNRANGRVTVSARDDGSLVEFAICDDGPGIPEDFHDRIFRIFETLKARDEVEGSGMGLALVKKTVETHGGTITLDSAVGKGATLRFTWRKESGIE